MVQGYRQVIRLAGPLFDEEEFEKVKGVLQSGSLVQGEMVSAFEEALKGFTGAEWAVATSSGTSAIHLLLLSLGIGEGDEVVIPDFTFPSVANMVLACGAVPVAVDAELLTFNMDVHRLGEKITARTKAIVATHLFGIPMSLERVKGAVRSSGFEGIALIEDAACGLGSYIRGADGEFLHTGRSGIAGILSFHPRKIITTGEGGAVITGSREIAERVRSLRNHGITLKEDGPSFENRGFNYRMTDIGGALGLSQMKKARRLLRKRGMVGLIYKRELNDLEGLVIPEAPEDAIQNFQSFPLLLPEGVERGEIIKGMAEEGIETGIATYSLHREPLFEKMSGFPPGDFPVSDTLALRGLCLPIHPLMGEEDAMKVASTFKSLISYKRR